MALRKHRFEHNYIMGIFNIEKATQAAAYLLKKSGGQSGTTWLVKMIYFAERKSIELWNVSMFGEDCVSMPFGPVPSNTYQLLKNGNNEIWNDYISREHSGRLSLKVANPSTGALSEAELELLDDLCEFYITFSARELSELTHNPKYFPEWKNPNGGSAKISLDDFCDALNKTDDERAFLKSNYSMDAKLSELCL
jgi:uncharacterized phage-associated protein